MASLIIGIQDIPDEGLDFESQVTRTDLDFGEGDPVFKKGLEFTARLHSDGNEAWVEGTLRGILIQECVRCLCEFNQDLDIPVRAHYRIQPEPSTKEHSKRQKTEDSESEEEDVESYPILNHQVNLAEMLREQVILSIPIQPVCQENCQGLCQVCGQNLNVQRCECQPQAVESPFAVLREKFKPSRPSQQ